VIPRYAEARQAVAAALRIRQKVGIQLDHPVAIIDIALQLGILVSFMRLASMEGLWCKEKRAIVLTSLRPAGRRTFTCAHEIAHCHFDHGTRIDDLLEYAISDSFHPEEYLANEFAAHLLMPLYAVSRALQIRKWNAATLTALQVYTLASHFGVSYGAMLNHLYFAFKMVRKGHFEVLSRTSPKMIRSLFCPSIAARHLVVVDEFWRHRPVDLEVDDLLILPQGTEFDRQLLESVPCQTEFDLAAYARSAGIGYLFHRDGSQLLLRVIPKEFEGFAEYRFPDRNNVYVSS
jgi:Zn-dependent peptidase ImmA (M78 family)